MHKTKSIVKTISLLLVGLLISLNTHAQKGDLKDKKGLVQKEIWKKLDVPEAPILNPQDALKSFQLPDGFDIELVASEPLINDPVAITWDEDGRMYAVEMWAFMPNVDGTGENKPSGRVVVLEDKDKDGVMDRSTVYLDNLVMPRAVAVVKGGVLIAEPPTLWFCEDTNNDLKCDKKTKVADYATKGTVEHMENTLMRGMDNWLYNSRSSRRFSWDGSSITEEYTPSAGQWGLSMDDYGRIFSSNNSSLLNAKYYPSQYVMRNKGYKSKLAVANGIASENRVYANRINPGINRGYKDAFIRDDYRLARATAASGTAIYRGDKLPPDFYGDAFTTEPAGNLVAHISLNDDGLEVSAEKQTYKDPKWERVDFLTSTDERFRPVNAYTGPDGHLYIVDMYRGIVQHKEFVTTFLRKQILERGLDKPVGLGRVYRIVHNDSTKKGSVLKLSKYNESRLVNALNDDNGWVRDKAQQLLVEKDSLKSATVKKLAKLVKSENELSAIHALWVLHAHDEITSSISLDAFGHRDEWVRVHGMRTAEALLSRKTNDSELVQTFLRLMDDKNKRVRLQVLQSLYALADDQLVVDQVKQLFHPDSSNPHFKDSAVATLDGREKLFIETILNSHWVDDAGRADLLSKLIEALFKKKQGQDLLDIYSSVSKVPQNKLGKTSWKVKALIEALSQAAGDKEAKAVKLKQKPKAFLQYAASLDKPTKVNFKKVFSWPGKKNTDPLAYLSEAQKQSIERGSGLYLQYCAACHSQDGNGVPSLAPSLNDSPYVNDSAEKLTLIVAQGLSGKIIVHGKEWDGVMPPHGGIKDLQGQGMADLLSFIRSSWANKSGPVTQEQVESVLGRFKARKEPWTDGELGALEF